MQARQLLNRAANKTRRVLASRLSRRVVPVDLSRPIISFTFDDAPLTAFEAGGDILGAYGARATYYLSLGLIGRETEVGKIAEAEDIARAAEAGYELGCHTYDHHDAWFVPETEFLSSIDRNRLSLMAMLPRMPFETFAYPKSGASIAVKSKVARQFICCRGGGQVTNAGMTDLNLLSACFLDRRTGIDLETVQTLIDDNAARRGWLIFATHDVVADPSPYGCTPRFLDAVADLASRSGALLLPVAEACRAVTATPSRV